MSPAVTVDCRRPYSRLDRLQHPVGRCRSTDLERVERFPWRLREPVQELSDRCWVAVADDDERLAAVQRTELFSNQVLALLWRQAPDIGCGVDAHLAAVQRNLLDDLLDSC